MALLLRVGSIPLSPKRIVIVVAASICLLGVIEAPSVRAAVAEMAPQIYDKTARTVGISR
ncbi:hypothetical protein [Mycolicibacterium sp. CBMA 226]|uniref:hypothetical protein n=1 Tax=Mycolicibacterium sp. CBMA 226 TaxID=2606611 RepID=UPI0012DC5C8C|nr:hypothetical protein [Mycolicibacterium sp. CBMA 226]MUL77695.1 hypothetical protein [Mycolicibacterium sp. CBMA 226]